MKYKHSTTLVITLALFLFAAFFAGACKSPNATPSAEKFTLRLVQDSGYINGSDGLRFLADQQLIDTALKTDWEGHLRYALTLPTDTDTTNRYYSYWDFTAADTAGKYYRMRDRYCAAITLDRLFLLMELSPQGKLLAYELYGHGSHACCWDSLDDMLTSYGHGFFGVSTCGTGSAYCSKYLSIFKDHIIPQSEYDIPAFEFVGGFGKDLPGHVLTSTLQLQDSTLTMQYELRGFYTDDKTEKEISTSTKHLTIRYTFSNNRFESKERDKLDEILM